MYSGKRSLEANKWKCMRKSEKPNLGLGNESRWGWVKECGFLYHWQWMS